MRKTDKMVTLRDICGARKRIKPFVNCTPLIYSQALSDQMNTSVYLKLENLQRTDSFKIRGVANKILSLTEQERGRGLVTFSTGNFAYSVAWMAQELGMQAIVCISGRVSAAKKEKLKNLGVEIEISGTSQDDAEKRCYELAREQGLIVVHPFDDPHVIAGQGTIALEILADMPEVDTVIGGLSGGGLHAGLGAAFKSADHDIGVYGVSPEHGAAMYESIKRGAPVVVEEQDTLADSLLGGIGIANRYTFYMVQQYVDNVVLLTEQEIAAGMVFIEKEHRMLVEGAAAAGIGAMLNGKVPLGSHVVAVMSGCSVDPSMFKNHEMLLEQYNK